ncbi:hypothetical protein CANINC_001540 [Pichia inconspicua]|uniref:Dynactin subunit 4 n=1 Tax=Pichia inconspicua TaxID=52247 RepID=A0A4T0X3G2_9ASCO|nr:hypothetical protein CANINC_001540 [[Candida] inconspicua]
MKIGLVRRNSCQKVEMTGLGNFQVDSDLLVEKIMELSIASAQVLCSCDGDTEGSYNAMKNMRYCDKCLVKRCLYCTLHTVTGKRCNRCERDYDTNDTHCLRCYECPVCGTALSTYPVPYTDENGVMKVAREKDAKIVGKAVFFKCKRNKCEFRFGTHIETRPQTLQEIVQGSVKDFETKRYNELLKYYEECINYQRILDKRQRTKWRSEIMKRFGDLEVAKILEEDNNISNFESKERVIVSRKGCETKKLVPIAKKLTCTMIDVCITCLQETKSLKVYAPVAYSVIIQENKFVSFLNKSETTMHITVLEEGYEFDLNPCNETMKSIPTCLLGYIEGTDEWKKEVNERDVPNFEECKREFSEVGDGWVTFITKNQNKISILVNSICVEYYIL